MAKQLEGRGIQQVVASDLTRSEQTGKVIAWHLGVPMQTTKGLRPWHLGVLQNQPSKDATPVINHFARETPDQKVPEGESFNDFAARFGSTLERLEQSAAKTGATIAIIAHYRNLKMIQAGMGQGRKPGELDLDAFTRNDIDPGAILLLEPNGTGWKARLVSRGMRD